MNKLDHPPLDPARNQRTPMARPPLVRMMAIHQAIASCRNPNATTLAAELEVTVKTIHRDISCMRDQLRLPVEYDRAVCGYVYTEPVESFPLMTLTEGDLFAMLVARQAIEQYAGTPFAEPLQSAFDKVCGNLTNVLHMSADSLAVPVSFRQLGAGISDVEVFQVVSAAVVQRHELQFEHRKLGEETILRRHIRPYHLACLEGQWYVVGHDMVRNSIRIFALARIGEAKLLPETFEVPEDFSINELLKNSFSAFMGEGRHTVVVQFDAWAAQLIKERSWHPEQRFRPLADKGVELTLKVPALEDVERWILSWGDHALVTAPEELVVRIRARIQRMQSAYGQLELFPLPAG